MRELVPPCCALFEARNHGVNLLLVFVMVGHLRSLGRTGIPACPFSFQNFCEPFSLRLDRQECLTASKKEADRVIDPPRLSSSLSQKLLGCRRIRPRRQARLIARGCILVQGTILHGLIDR